MAVAFLEEQESKQRRARAAHDTVPLSEKYNNGCIASFHDKGTHILSTVIQYVLSTQCSGATYYVLRVLAMLAFAVIILNSEVELGPYSLQSKKVISAIKLNTNIIRSRHSFPRKKR